MEYDKRMLPLMTFNAILVRCIGEIMLYEI